MASDDDRDHAGAELADVHLTERPRVAGGWGAIAATTRHLFRDSGLVRGGKALLAMNQADGFDCPGCAWPEPAAAERAAIEFCENGAKALAEEATSARATPALFAARSIDELRALSDFELGQLGRITEPMIKDAGSRHYRAATWEQALAVVAGEMRIAGPQRTALYTSGRTSNEAAFLYQLVGRWFGTNHFPDCSNMCHESSGVALSEVIGVGKGTVSLADFEHADLILVLGQNPGTNHPRMLTTLRDAARRGAEIVSINPLREAGLGRFAHPQKPLDLFRAVPLAKDFVQVQIGGDLAFVRGVAKATIEAGAIDHDFVRDRTTGFDAWRDAVAATPWDALERGAGVERDAMQRVADRYARAERTIACWAMGLTQHKDSVATIQEIVNLMLLRGNVGREGAGLCPVRGHSNVQGDRTMGITPRPKPALLDALGAAFGFAPPREPGLDTVDTVRAMERGEIVAFVAMGGNFAAACSDTARTVAALERCALTAGVTTKLNRTHLYPGRRAVILPCLGRSEIDEQAGGPQFVTVEDSMSIVHRSRGVLAPAAAALRSEPAIVAGLGRALLGDVMPWDDLVADYDRIRDLIAAVIPGFDDFNGRVRAPDGFQLPNSARDGTFAAVGGRAAFTVSELPDLSLPAGRLRMMTIRSHDQFNTTVYGLDDRYRGIRGERRVVLMNSADMVALDLVERQVVDLISEWRGQERVAPRFIVVPYDIPRGNCATYFPEANPLVPLDSVADKSNTPTSKSVVVRLDPTTSRSGP
jgi:molybdopterin-dependent oxidoreductase alpha subunit